MVKARCSITLIRINDGDSGIIVSAIAPVNPTVGQLWQTATKQPIKRWDGAAWVMHYISVDNLDVQNLSSITANLGIVTAGKIQNEEETVIFDVENGVFKSSNPDSHSLASTEISDGKMISIGKGPSTNLQQTVVSHEGIKYEHQPRFAVIYGEPDGDFKIKGTAIKNSFKFGDFWVLSEIIKNIYLLLHPVGDIVMNTSGINPGTKFGGSWALWGSGRVPVGVDTADTSWNTPEKLSGSKSVNVPHAHTTAPVALTIPQMPSHSHLVSQPTGGQFIVPKGDFYGVYATSMQQTGSAGGGQAHGHGNTGTASPGVSVVQPSISCYMWKRTA